MKKPVVLRKRYIPYEVVDISSDELLFRNDELLVTRWKAIRPRADILGGVSFTFLKDGYKIGRFYDRNGKFIYWYCDIIDVEYDPENDIYTLVDLLVDIKLMPDGTVKVIDADELADALEKGLITKEQACRALRKLDGVLKIIYEGCFPPDICEKEEYRTMAMENFKL